MLMSACDKFSTFFVRESSELRTTSLIMFTEAKVDIFSSCMGGRAASLHFQHVDHYFVIEILSARENQVNFTSYWVFSPCKFKG